MADVDGQGKSVFQSMQGSLGSPCRSFVAFPLVQSGYNLAQTEIVICPAWAVESDAIRQHGCYLGQYGHFDNESIRDTQG